MNNTTTKPMESKQTPVDWLFSELWEHPKDKFNWYTIRKIALQMEEKQQGYSEEEVISLLEYVRKNYYDTGTIWHSDSDVAYTSEELLKQFKNNGSTTES